MITTEKMPDVSVNCLVCGQIRLVSVERKWDGPAVTEFAQDLTYCDRLSVAGTFFVYSSDKLDWERPILTDSYCLYRVNGLRAGMVFVCDCCCLKKDDLKRALLNKEVERLSMLISDNEMFIRDLDKKMTEDKLTLSRLQAKLTSIVQNH